MRNMKRFMLCFILVFLMGAYGCTMMPNHELPKANHSESEQDVIRSMQDHLTQKYGTFNYQIDGFIWAGWDFKYDLLNLTTTIDGEEYSFSVERHKEENGYSFEDNYFGLLIKKDYEAAVFEHAVQYFPSCFVAASTMSVNYPNTLTGVSTFEDLLSEKDNISGFITVVVVVDETFTNTDEFEKAAKQFCDDWNKVGLRTLLRVIYVTHETYSNTNQSNIREQGILIDNRITEYTE